MRNFHRWISSVAMLFLAWVAVTGVVLALDTLYPPAGLDSPGPAPNPEAFGYDRSAPLLDRAALEAQVATSLRTAFANVSVNAPTALDLQLSRDGAQPRATVVFTADRAQTLAIDPTQGKLLSSTTVWQRPGATVVPWYDNVSLRLHWHELLQDLHRGSIIGISGQVMDILTGLSFVFLSVTGIVMYFQMLKQRRQSGRPRLFWQ